MMKKMLSIILKITMLFSMAIAAFADDAIKKTLAASVPVSK